MTIDKKQPNKINEIVYNQDIPTIIHSTIKISPTGQELHKQYIEIRGKTLKEVEEIYNRIKGK